ncbi:hypothetical protein BHM03_00002594, partial [Ensete ventricosum]
FHSFGIYIFPDKIDIVDEAITFFRANVFFKNFDIKSPADKLLIYLTFYINVALKRLEGCRTLAVGTKAIINLGLEKVPVPGEPGFPFPGLFSVPRTQDEAGIYFWAPPLPSLPSPGWLANLLLANVFLYFFPTFASYPLGATSHVIRQNIRPRRELRWVPDLSPIAMVVYLVGGGKQKITMSGLYQLTSSGGTRHAHSSTLKTCRGIPASRVIRRGWPKHVSCCSLPWSFPLFSFVTDTKLKLLRKSFLFLPFPLVLCLLHRSP